MDHCLRSVSSWDVENFNLKYFLRITMLYFNLAKWKPEWRNMLVKWHFWKSWDIYICRFEVTRTRIISILPKRAPQPAPIAIIKQIYAAIKNEIFHKENGNLEMKRPFILETDLCHLFSHILPLRFSNIFWIKDWMSNIGLVKFCVLCFVVYNFMVSSIKCCEGIQCKIAYKKLVMVL